MKPGFLLEAARKDAKSMVHGGIGLCVIALLVLLLNGKYVYNWLAGPFEITPMAAELSSMKEFGQIRGTFIKTPLVEQSTTKLRVFRVVTTVSTDITAHIFLVPVNDKFLVVKASPDFSGDTARGRLVSLPEKLRTTDLISQTKVGDQTITPDRLCSMMLDASSSYRTDANLFVIGAAFFLGLGLFGTVISMAKAGSPQKFPMLRMVARTGPVLSTLRKIEQEFIAAGDAAHVGPLMISSSWIYDPVKPLLFPLKDIVGVNMKVGIANKAVSTSVEFWLRNAAEPHSVKAGVQEGEAILKALAVQVPWAILEPGSSIESRWKNDRQGCIAEMERRRTQMQTAALAAK